MSVCVRVISRYKEEGLRGEGKKRGSPRGDESTVERQKRGTVSSGKYQTGEESRVGGTEFEKSGRVE